MAGARKASALKGKGGLIMVGATLILGIWLIIDFRTPESRAPDALPHISEYTHLRSPDVQRVELRRGASVFTLARRGGKWAFEQPKPYRANSAEIDKWLKSLLEEATIAQEVAGKPSDMSQFGLDKPVAELVLTRGGETRTLQLGSDFKAPGSTAAATGFYAREVKDGRLFLIASLQADDLKKKKLEDFRDKRLLDFEDDKAVQRVVITRAADTLEVARSKDAWAIKQPFPAPAEKFDVESLITSVRTAEADAFADDAATDLAKYALDKPALKVELTLNNGRQVLLFGGTAPNNRVYAVREGEREVVMVASTTFDTLNKKPADLRERKLITLEQEKIRSIELKTSSGTLRLQKVSGDKWQYADGPNAPFTEAKAESVRTILSSALAPAHRHVQEAPTDWKVYGLDTPEITVTLSDGVGSAQTLMVGKKSAGEQYYARGVPNAAFEVQRFVHDDLNVKADFFKPAAGGEKSK